MADPRVLRAMSTPLLGQFDPEFTAIMYEVVALSRVAFQRGDDNLGAEGTGRI
jgi:(S)-ureidoglycine-glyoxylate aminotransferase